jgi:hypothetical protein
MRSFAVAALASLTAAYTPISEMELKFINYVAKFGKSYATKEEYNFRMELFATLDAQIVKINNEQSSFALAHNKFSDYTPFEYK